MGVFLDRSVTGNKTFSFDASGDAPAYYRIANYWYDNETNESSYTTVGTWNDGELKIGDTLMRWYVFVCIQKTTSVNRHSSGPIHPNLGQIETDVFNKTKYKHGLPPFSNCSAECDRSEKRVYANNEALECCWTCAYVVHKSFTLKICLILDDVRRTKSSMSIALPVSRAIKASTHLITTPAALGYRCSTCSGTLSTASCQPCSLFSAFCARFV